MNFLFLFLFMINQSNITIISNKETNWTPTFEDAQKVEPIVKEYLDKVSKKSEKIFQKDVADFIQKNQLETYYRQYSGIVEKGDSILWINFVCAQSIKHYPDWKTEIISVRGGGACYFRLYIDMKKQEVKSISVNSLR